MNFKSLSIVMMFPVLMGIQTGAAKKVKFQGLYMTEATGSGEEASRNYLRFYANDSVVSVSAVGKPEEIDKWFNLSHKYLHKGVYQVNRKNISFTTQLAGKKIEYSGVISGKTLKLHWKSEINGKEGDRIYNFYKIKSR